MKTPISINFLRSFLFLASVFAVLGVTSLEAADEQCSRHFLGSWTNGLVNLLTRHDLRPFHLGSEIQPLLDIEAALDTSLENQALSLAVRAAFEDSQNWEPIGEDKDFGTHVSIPDLLQGEVIAGIARPLGEKWKFISGKVVRVQVVSAQDEETLRTRLTLAGTDGPHVIHLPGAIHLHQLKRTQGSRVQRILQKLKTTVENKVIDARDFYEHLVETKGLKIVLRARNLREEQDSMRWAGLLKKESSDQKRSFWVLHPIRLMSLGVTRAVGAAQNRMDWAQNKVYFAPALLQFAHHNLLRRPSSQIIVGIEWAAKEITGPWKSPGLQKLFSQKLEFSSLINIIGGSLAFVLAYNIADGYWNNHIVSERNQVVYSLQDEWLVAMQTDPFLGRVYDQWSQGTIDDREASEETFLRLDSLSIIYELMDIFPESENASLLSFIEDDDYLQTIFPATMFIQRNGPIDQAGIEVPEDQKFPASPEEMQALVQINRDLFERRPLVMEWAEGDFETIKEMTATHPELASEWDLLQQDDYLLELIRLHSMGQIDEGELLFLMLENLQWQEKFSRWSVFGAVRYAQDDKGTRRALDLEDFQAWRLKHLFENSEWIRTRSAVDFYPHSEFNNRHHIDRLGPNLALFYALGAAAPFFRRFLHNPKLFRGLIKGRYKNAMKAKRAKAIVLLTAAGEVQSRTKHSNLATLMTMAGTLLIAWDIYAHWVQLARVEGDVREVLVNPFIDD